MIQVHVIQMLHAQMLLGRLYVNVYRVLAVMDQRVLVCVFNLFVLTPFRQRQCYIHNVNILR